MSLLLAVRCLLFLLLLFAARSSLLAAELVLAAQDELAAPLVNGYNEPKYFLGVSVGYGRVLMNTDKQVYDNSLDTNCACSTFSNGSGEHFKIGLSGDYFLGDHAPVVGYLTGQLDYAWNKATFDEPGDRLPSLDSDGNVIYSSIYNRFETTFQSFDAVFGIGLKSQHEKQGLSFAIDVSAIASVVTSAQSKTQMTITEPLNSAFDSTLFGPDEIEYENDGRTVVTQRFDQSMHASVLFGGQVSARLNVTSVPFQVQIVPYYRYYFNSIHNFASTTVHVVALDLRVGIL